MSISVNLSSETDALWRSCFSMEHEMILTVAGRRIFPTLEYSITGLNPLKTYSMCLYLDLVDDKKLRFSNGNWIETLSTEKKDPPRKVWHQNGALTGAEWMKKPVNFDQVRITNRKSKEEGSACYVHLHTQHRYIPVLSIFEEMEMIKTVRIPHSQFITVTAYHKPEINTLKTNNNPYSTGSRKDRRRERQSPPSSEESGSNRSSLSPPLSKKIKEEPQETLPLAPIAQSDYQMLQTFLLSQMTYPFNMTPPNPFMNPFFSPYSSLFQSPAPSPQIEEFKIEGDSAEADDVVVDVV